MSSIKNKSKSSEEDNYMELYVQKELKDKFNPLQEQQLADKGILTDSVNRLDKLESTIRKTS